MAYQMTITFADKPDHETLGRLYGALALWLVDDANALAERPEVGPILSSPPHGKYGYRLERLEVK